MSSFEQFEENDPELLLAPTVFAAHSRQELRRAVKIDSDFSLSLLEHEFASRGLDERPRFFKTTMLDGDPSARQETLVLPFDDSHNTTSFFVAVNTVRAHPTSVDSERLITTAYKFLPATHHLLQSSGFASDKHKGDTSWPIEQGFGPFLYYVDGLLEMTQWDEQRLVEPPTLPPRLSVEYSERGRRAQRLLRILRGLRTIDEIEDFVLLATEV